MTDRSNSNPPGWDGDVLEAALLLAERGFRVFPCLPLKKEPAIKAWQNHATTEPHIIRGWFSEFPDRNLAVACGPQPNGMNLLVIDIDPRHGGLESWHKLLRVHGDAGLRDAPCHRTPNGGFHLFLDAPKDFRNSRNRLGAGIDTRGAGGYVLVPPSLVRLDEGEAPYVANEALWDVE